MDISELQRQRSAARHPWELSRTQIIKSLLKNYLPSFKTIVDVGSGDNFVLKELAKEDVNRTLISIDSAFTPEIIEKLKAESEINIHFLYHPPNALTPPADCILFLDVLEHCKNDLAVLSYYTNPKISSNETVFLITVPAFPLLFSEHDRLLNHYRRYTKKQLVALCETSGLEVINKGYFFSSLLLPRLFHLFLEKIHFKKANRSIDNWDGGRLSTQLLKNSLFFDYIFSKTLSKIGIELPGLSVYCLCRKSQL